MTEATDALIDRIRKLAAKAASTDNEAEAAAFSAKVQELLAAHGLSEEMLAERAEDPIGEERWEWQYNDPWRRMLCRAAAQLYFCSTYSYHFVPKDPETGERDYINGRFRYGMTFVGRAHNVAVARSMTEYLIATTVRLGYAYAEENQIEERAPRKSFQRGCGVRLAERLGELYWAQRNSRPQRDAVGNPRNLPALYADEDKLVENFLKDKGLKRYGRGTNVDGEHAEAGARAAETVGLNAQVPGSKTRMLT